MKFCFKMIEDGDNAETWSSWAIEYVYRMYSFVFVGVTEALR